MSSSRLLDYLDHMQQATADVISFVDGLNHADFLNDKRTQQAVIMNLIIIGEAATKVMERCAAFTQAHPEVPWHSMRGMRNRMTHGYLMSTSMRCGRRHSKRFQSCSRNCSHCAWKQWPNTVTTKEWQAD
jgi:uncharacterized protein with HEPN domain